MNDGIYELRKKHKIEFTQGEFIDNDDIAVINLTGDGLRMNKSEQTKLTAHLLELFS